MELQKKHGENKKISRIYLDPHGDHLLVNTDAGDTFYFGVRNTRHGKGRPVSRLNNVHIESIAWNNDATTSTTKDVLIGTRDGTILETYLEISDYIPNARYVRQLRNYGTPIIGLHVEKSGELRDVFVGTNSGITVYSGRISRKSDGEIASLYATFFDDSNSGRFEESSGSSSFTKLAILPRMRADARCGPSNAYFAWATRPGLFHGKISSPKSANDDSTYCDSILVPYSNLFSPFSDQKPVVPELSQFHILVLHENQLVAVNRINNRVVFKENIAAVPYFVMCTDARNKAKSSSALLLIMLPIHIGYIRIPQCLKSLSQTKIAICGKFTLKRNCSQLLKVSRRLESKKILLMAE